MRSLGPATVFRDGVCARIAHVPLLAVPVTALIAFVAAYLPARRALHLDPVQTLTAE